jgi:hypothetical protein
MIKKVIVFFIVLAIYPGTSVAVQVHSVERQGRMIQLDGFLLEWKKADARPLTERSVWFFDAITSREGLAGYFKTDSALSCGLWKFRFLPKRLSPYKYMELLAEADSSLPFYKVSSGEATGENGVTAEWVVPWDSIQHDSSAAFQVGLIVFDTCGDTLPPMIFSGHVYRQETSLWSGIYAKGIVLIGLMFALFVLQKRARAKFRTNKKRR